MNNALQMLKVQELVYSNQDKLESIITAIESVLSPTMGEGDTQVAIEKEKPYKWSEKDFNSLVLDDDTNTQLSIVDMLIDIDTDGDLETTSSVHHPENIAPYRGKLKLHFTPWKAGSVPKDIGDYYAILFNDGDISVYSYQELDHTDTEYQFSKAFDLSSDIEVVGYCNLNFVNTILEE